MYVVPSQSDELLKTRMCVCRNKRELLHQSGSDTSAAASGLSVFCLYMKVSRKSAMSCEHQ